MATKRKRTFKFASLLPDPSPDRVSKVVKIRFARSDPDNYILYRYNFSKSRWEQYVDSQYDIHPRKWVPMSWETFLSDGAHVAGSPDSAELVRALALVF